MTILKKVRRNGLFFLSMVMLTTLVMSCGADVDSPPQVPFSPDRSDDFDTTIFKWGYITPSGKSEIAPQYDEVRPFKEGRAVVRNGGFWSMIDRQGERLTTEDYIGLWSLQNGRARAQRTNEKFGFLNALGDPISDFEYDVIDDFSEGLAVVGKAGSYGYINDAGAIEIPFNFAKAKAFEFGLAVVEQDGKTGIVNKVGQFVIPPTYDRLQLLADSLVRAKLSGQEGVIDLAGKWVIPPTFKKIKAYHAGLFAAKRDAAYGLINKKGKWVVEPRFDDLYYANEDRWVVIENGKFGLLDALGNVVLPPRLNQINKFSESKAAFNLGSNWGYLSPDGSIAIAPQYILTWDFGSGYARVASRNGIFLIDAQGNQTLPIRYLDIRDVSQGLVAVQLPPVKKE